MTATNESARGIRRPYQRSRQHLRDVSAGGVSLLGQFLDPFSVSVDRLFDHFNGVTLNSNIWTTTEDNGGTAFAQGVASAEATMITGLTDAGSGDGLELTGPRHYLGDKNCVMEVRWKLSAVSNLRLEIGFSDIRSAALTACISDIDGPTAANGSTNLAIMHIDTSQTLTTAAFVTDGSTASYDTTKTALGTQAFAGSTWYTTRIGIVDDAAFCHVYNTDDPQAPALLESAYHGQATAQKIEGGTLLIPYVLVETLTTAAKTMDIDYVLLIQDA